MTRDPQGSLGEEAARLADAVQDWLRGFPDLLRTPGATGTDHGVGPSPECQVCPACQLLRLVRTTRPEVYAHLTDAAVSMNAAVRELIERDSRPRTSTVEHIDLG